MSICHSAVYGCKNYQGISDISQVVIGNIVLSRANSFLDAAEGYDFVMSAVLAFAATHLAWLTHSTETKNLAYHHRGVALKGLHDAIGHFSRESSDAILAASILLSWQTSDW